MHGFFEQLLGVVGIAAVKCDFTEIKVGYCRIRVELKYSIEFFFCRFYLSRFEQQHSEIRDYISIARVFAQLSEEVFVSLFGIAVGPVCLGNSIVDLWVRLFNLSGFLPATDCLFVLASYEEAVADIVVAQCAIRFDMLGHVEHLFCQIVLFHFSVRNNSIAVARLVHRVKRLGLFESFNRSVILSAARIVHSE